MYIVIVYLWLYSSKYTVPVLSSFLFWVSIETLHSTWALEVELKDLCCAALVLGRELHVVVNTNDPDYEHTYSIEAYDNPLDELLYFTPSAKQNDGTMRFITAVLFVTVVPTAIMQEVALSVTLSSV